MRAAIWRRAIPALTLAMLVAVIGLLHPGGTARAAGCVVTNTNDSGAGSLRAAIGNTDGYSNCDTITFNLSAGSTITLTGGTLSINRSLTITGPGAAALTVARSAATGTPDFSLFRVASGTVTISGLTISGGRAIFGGGIEVAGGTVTLDTLVVSGNTSPSLGGGIAVTGGGTATLTNSIVSGNIVSSSNSNEGWGGGVAASFGGTLRVERSLITGNRSSYVGGGVWNLGGSETGSDVTIVNSTIVGNEASLGGGAAAVGRVTLINSTLSGNGADFGGNLFNGGTILLRNTIVANSTRGSNCTNSFVDLGYNLADDGSCGLSTANNSLPNTPDGLDPAGLRDNGGPTQTIALLPGSAALNRIPASGAECPATDQRGIARPQPSGGSCDIGAFESRGFAINYNSGGNQSAVINTQYASPIVVAVSSHFNEPVVGGVVTLTGPASGPGIQGSPLTATIVADGTASFTLTANGTVGTISFLSVTAKADSSAFGISNWFTNLPIPTTLIAQAASGTYGGTVTLRATLTATSGSADIAGKTAAFTLNGTPVGTATTNSSGVAELTGVSLGAIGVGTYAAGVSTSFAGDTTHAASSGIAPLTVAKAASTTNVTTPDSPYTGSPYAGASAVATGAGGLNAPVTAFTYSGRNGTSYGPSATAPTNVGDYTATATYGGDANHTGNQNDDDFSITRATATITFDTASLSQVYDGTPRTATATTDPAGLAYAVTYDDGTTAPTNAGTYPVAAIITDPNYTGDTTDSLIISQATSITTMSAPNAAYTGSPYAGASAVATGAGGLNTPVMPITYSGRNGTVYSASTTPPTNAGDYTASATFAGDANHTGSDGSADFTINKAAQSITFLPDPLPARAVGTAPFDVAATASSTHAVSFAAGPANVCTVSGARVTIKAVGTCTVTASQVGSGNFQPASSVERPFQVTEAATTTAVRGTATYGDATATLTATITRTAEGQPVPPGGVVTFTFGGATRTATTNAQGVATVTVPLPPGQAAGNFAGRVQAVYAGTASALPSSGTGPLVVARRLLWVKPVDQTVGLRQPTPTSCALELTNGSAFAPGDSWAALNLTQLRCAYSRSGTGPANEKVGAQYRISALGALSTNYDIRYETGTLTVK